MTASKPFWETKQLTEMSSSEWESLCDGCGKCCLVKLVDEDTEELHFTDVSCYLLNIKTCKCTRYAERQRLVPDCIKVKPENIAELKFMPSTCAYRLLAEGEGLPSWHPLVCGSPAGPYRAGASARYRCISEEEVEEEDLPAHIVDWAR